VILVLVTVLLGWAAVEDVCRRIIPDTVPAAIAVIAIAGPVVEGDPPWSALVLAILAGLVLMAAGARGFIGGGDVKLASALTLLAGIDRFATFAMGTALAGGALSLVYAAGWFAARRLRLVRRLLRLFGGRRRCGVLGRLAIEEVHRIATRHSIPYGVALAAGGWLALSQPS
jgi:prepilin peptidase CpaA